MRYDDDDDYDLFASRIGILNNTAFLFIACVLVCQKAIAASPTARRLRAAILQPVSAIETPLTCYLISLEMTRVTSYLILASSFSSQSWVMKPSLCLDSKSNLAWKRFSVTFILSRLRLGSASQHTFCC